MFPINTIDDLFQALDENPRILEAVRARLLTRELLELPQVFAEFVKTTDKRFEAVEKRLDGIDGRLDGIDGRLDRADGRLDGIDGRLDEHDKHLRRIDNSLGVLKGGHARGAALRDTALIADSMGFDLVRTMSQREIISLARSQNARDIPKNELHSFVRADLIMEVVNGSEEVCYIAVEISFTVDERDTDRAIRNAKFLTQFTGKPAYAAVAGLDRDNRIQSSIEAGDVFWHQLDSEDLEVD
ncbi:MAG: hypothetical protein OXG87_17545 [Gemmatimonadetes bacterium]|nr:hypothetical protein [Gemmatimonadota bacterium]